MSAITLSSPKPKECEECGNGTVFHNVSLTTILIDEFIWSIFKPSDKSSFIKRQMLAFEYATSAAILEFFVHIHLANKVTEMDDDTQLLAQMLWIEAKKRGIDMWEWRLFGLARNIFVAKFPSGKKIAFEGIPNPPGHQGHVWWMDNKAVLKSEFLKHGIAVAKGGCAKTEKQAREIFNTLTPPVIVKPYSGSGSRHTFLHLMTEEEMLKAFRSAKQICPGAIIEEELVGPVYRATVVDGKFIAAIRRDPPSVVGDGVHAITKLVEIENQNPGRSGPYFSQIQLFAEDGSIQDVANKELKWQKLNPESVPEKDKRVYFHQKVNWSVGGTTCDVTDDVHPDNIELFEKAARELRAPITGIDFIIKDISKSWKDVERAGILECNSMPFFDNHHLPYEGKPRNVATKIWDMVTPAS